MARTPDNRRVKTRRLGYSYEQDGAENEITINAGAIATFDDDVRIVGVEIISEINLSDTQLNADDEVQMVVEVGKNGQMYGIGAFGSCESHGLWTAVISVYSNVPRGQIYIPLTGANAWGVDIDDGESIYLHAYMAHVSALPCSFFGHCYIHYVER